MTRTSMAAGAAAIIVAAAGASAQSFSGISNGDFESGTAGWAFFNNAFFQDGAVDPDPNAFYTDGNGNHVKAFGLFSGGESFNGVAQDLTGWSFGDTIDFGADVYSPTIDNIVGSANEVFVALNFFDASNNFLFNVPTAPFAGPVDQVETLSNTFVLDDPGLDGLVDRIELVLIVRQPAGNFDGGAAFFDNAFATITPIPAPGAIAILGLGAVATRRRRA